MEWTPAFEGRACSSSECHHGFFLPAGRCAADGGCDGEEGRSCAPYATCADTTTCAHRCDDDAACVEGFACVDAACVDAALASQTEVEVSSGRAESEHAVGTPPRTGEESESGGCVQAHGGAGSRSLWLVVLVAAGLLVGRRRRTLL